MKHTFSIVDRPDRGFHSYTVRIDDGKPWLNNSPLSSTDEKLRLFRELLAWMQADGDLDIKLAAAK